jgi:hypothetical protein
VFSISSEKIGGDFNLSKYAMGGKEDQERFFIGGKPGIKVSLEMRFGEEKESWLNIWIYAIHKERVFDFSFPGEDGELAELIYKALPLLKSFLYGDLFNTS